jgi:integrase
MPTRDQIHHRLVELDRQRAELEEALHALQAGEVEPAGTAPGAQLRKNKLRLTKSSVRGLPIPNDKNAIYWDEELRGFGLRISPHGTKTYFLQARTKDGRGIKVTLGRAVRITSEQAREAAKKYLAQVDLGRDPAHEIKARRQAERERKLAPTMAALWADFVRNPVTRRDGEALRPKSLAAYKSWWSLHLEPRIGQSKVADVAKERVAQLHRELSAGAGRSTANRVLAVLSRLLSHAEDLGLVAANPCRGVRRNREHARERDLADVELRRLVAFLAASSSPEARLVELLLATGARKSEALTARWSDIREGWWIVPASISKSRKAQRKPLNAAALAVLAVLDRRGEELFPELTPSRLGRWWVAARSELRLGDVRLHDLRHAAASLALNAGVPLAAVGAMLGHGVHSATMTARYSHLADAQLAAASRAIADRLELLKAEPAGRA